MEDMSTGECDVEILFEDDAESGNVVEEFDIPIGDLDTADGDVCRDKK